jgi:hypothetical protein
MREGMCPEHAEQGRGSSMDLTTLGALFPFVPSEIFG